MSPGMWQIQMLSAGTGAPIWLSSREEVRDLLVIESINLAEFAVHAGEHT